MSSTNAKQKIKKSYLSLLATNGDKNISIQDITKNAGVSRSTYYSHYYDPKDILNDILNDLFVDLNKCQTQDYEHSYFCNKVNFLTNHAHQIIEWFRNNDSIITQLLNTPAEAEFRRELFTYCQKMSYIIFKYTDFNENNPDFIYSEEFTVYIQFIFSGQYDIVRTWLLSDPRPSFDPIYKLLSKAFTDDHIINSTEMH